MINDFSLFHQCLLYSNVWQSHSTEPRCIPWLWCSFLRYLMYNPLQHSFHMCWNHRKLLQCQTRFSSQCLSMLSHCFQGYRFLLWSRTYYYRQHWTLLYCSWLARRPENQSASSTCYDPVTLHGISRQQSVRTVSWPVCWWRGTWSDDRSSFFIPRQILEKGVFQ